MATKIASLAVEIGVDASQLEAGLKRAGLQLKNTGKEAETAGQKISNFAKGFGKFALEAGVTALAGAFVVATKAAIELETEFGKIAALTNTPQGAIEGLRKEVLALSTELPVSAQELSKALYFISSSGFQGADAMGVLKASAEAAAAGLGETQTIADAVTSAMNAYGKGVYSAAKITDLLTFAVKEGKGEPAELAGSLGRVLPIASQAKVSMEDVAAAMAVMTRTGMNADEAATSLRGTIGALLAPAKQSVGALAEIGLTTQDVASMLAKPGGLVEVLRLLMERTGGNIEQMDLIIPNIRALTGVLSLAGSQGEEYARVLNDAYKAEGLAAQGAAVMGDTMAAKLKKSENAVTNLGIAITEKLLPGLGDAADAATTLITWQDKMSAAFEGTSEKIRKESKTYEEYRENVLLVAVAAGKISEAMAEQIRQGGKLDVIIKGEMRYVDAVSYAADELGIMTESAYTAQKATAAQMLAVRQLGDQEERTARHGKTLSKSNKEVGVSALETKAAIEESTKSFQEYLNTITTDVLGLKEYNKEQGELKRQAAEVKAQIDELQGSHDKLSQTKLAELRGEYDGLIGKIGETTAAHEESTKRVILGFLEQRLAIDGLSQKEQDVLLGVANDFGLIEDSTVETIAAINRVADSFDPVAGNADKARAAINEVTSAILGIPSAKTVDIYVTEHYGRTGDTSLPIGSLNPTGPGVNQGIAPSGNDVNANPYQPPVRGNPSDDDDVQQRTNRTNRGVVVSAPITVNGAASPAETAEAISRYLGSLLDQRLRTR